MRYNEMNVNINDWFYLQGKLIGQLEAAAGHDGIPVITNETRQYRVQVRERIIGKL